MSGGVRIGWHPRGVDGSRRPPYRDREDSLFYQARGLSPEATWQVLADELARVLDDVQRTFWRTLLRMDMERVRWWHGAIFGRHFPHDGGHFRQGPAFFGVVMPGGGMRQLDGTAPQAIRNELSAVCALFNRRVETFDNVEAVSILDRTQAAAALYAGILGVHPFVDGNHRVGFVALSAALWSLGLPNVKFIGPEEMIAHDDALVPALLPTSGDVEPFARLLVERISHARKEPT